MGRRHLRGYRRTLKGAQAEVRDLGMVLTKNDSGEYRVNFKGGREDTAYYTDDLDDAVATAYHMIRRLKEIVN